MSNQSEIQNPKSEIAIVGAGPAGASLAIRLAQNGFEVVLVEREKFPRHKLCGEFVSPECLVHFAALGVSDAMFAAGGERITETVFYAPGGQSVVVPSAWLGGGALGISRAAMDFQLLERARALGVRVLEETQTVGVLMEKGEVCGVKVKARSGEASEIAADLTIDATGRASVLGKFLRKSQITDDKLQNKDQRSKIKDQSAKLVGFKAHLDNVRLERGRCEIYFFRGGYGGLNYVEAGRGNHCFLIKADIVKAFSRDAQQIIENVIFKNIAARRSMSDAAPVFDWLAVSVDGFGLKDLNPARNLYAVGDAAAFIDPFTGSGMLMALDGAEMLAASISQNRFSPAQIAADYNFYFQQKFRKRLRICAFLRRAAFVPNLAKTVISALSWSRSAQKVLARATRSGATIKKSNT